MTLCEDLAALKLIVCAEFGKNSPECAAACAEYELFCEGESASAPITDERRTEGLQQMKDLRTAIEAKDSKESASMLTFVEKVEAKYNE